MKFKLTQRVEFEDFVDKIKELLEELSPRMKATAGRVFKTRLQMESEGSTFRDLAIELANTKKIIDRCSDDVEDIIEAMLNFEAQVIELNKQAAPPEEQAAPPEEQQETKDEENI
tara:strand:- start:538 stop:882 length:345 start_codon:yes stop_codon:yes gene_type:complete